jgi:hypothetical protein
MAKLGTYRISLFLHGHLHEADFQTVVTSDDGWKTTLCSPGSAGASAEWLRSRYHEGHNNSLALYEIRDGKIQGRALSFDERFNADPPTRHFDLEIMT